MVSKQTWEIFSEQGVNSREYEVPHLVAATDNSLYVILDTKIIHIKEAKVQEIIPVVKLYNTETQAEINKKIQETADKQKFSSREERYEYLRKMNQEMTAPVNANREKVCQEFISQTTQFQSLLQDDDDQGFYISTDRNGEKKAIEANHCNIANTLVVSINVSRNTDTHTPEVTDNNVTITEKPYDCFNNCLKRKYTVKKDGRVLLDLDGTGFLHLSNSGYVFSIDNDFIFMYGDKLYAMPLAK